MKHPISVSTKPAAGHADPLGGLTPADDPLIQAEKLSEQAGPPHDVEGARAATCRFGDGADFGVMFSSGLISGVNSSNLQDLAATGWQCGTLFLQSSYEVLILSTTVYADARASTIGVEVADLNIRSGNDTLVHRTEW